MYVKVKIDETKCTGCKRCILTCPDPNVLILKENKKVSADENRCKGCGLCAANCPRDALTIS